MKTPQRFPRINTELVGEQPMHLLVGS